VSRSVAVVTDSTAYLPNGAADAAGVGVVPLQVMIDGRSGDEGTEIAPADVARALSQRGGRVTTSQPSPATLAAAYEAAAQRLGVSDVVAVHLSGALSGTVTAAKLAAQTLDGLAVRVLDSRLVAMGLGFSVLAAARAAEGGGGVDEVMQAARHTASRTRVLLYVDTLEHLRRGGRIGAASSLLGTALSVRPLLHMVDGETALLEKVRTTSRALARLEELAVAEAGEGPVDLTVHHLASPERAETLAASLRERVPRHRDLHVCEVGAVVGAHTGPGMLGVVVSRR
jgi:DegV family protein with EDD domain